MIVDNAVAEFILERGSAGYEAKVQIKNLGDDLIHVTFHSNIRGTFEKKFEMFMTQQDLYEFYQTLEAFVY